MTVTDIGTQYSTKTKSVRTQKQKEDLQEQFEDIEKKDKSLL